MTEEFIVIALTDEEQKISSPAKLGELILFPTPLKIIGIAIFPNSNCCTPVGKYKNSTRPVVDKDSVRNEERK